MGGEAWPSQGVPIVLGPEYENNPARVALVVKPKTLCCVHDLKGGSRIHLL